MFYLVLAILGSSMISIVMRFSENYIKGKTSMLAGNYMVCIISSLFFVGFDNIFPVGDVSAGYGGTALLGAINGVFYMVSLVIMQRAINKNGVVLSSVFSRLGGLMVPIAVSMIFFSEMPGASQLAGSIIAIGSIIALNYEKNEGGSHKAYFGILMLLFITDGLASVMAKVYGEVMENVLPEHFLMFTFTVALMLCLAVMLKNGEKPAAIDLLFGALVGIPNFFSSRFMLMALEEIPAVIVYPLRGVGGILLITLAGVFLFKERLQKHHWYAMAAILVAVVLLNI